MVLLVLWVYHLLFIFLFPYLPLGLHPAFSPFCVYLGVAPCIIFSPHLWFPLRARVYLAYFVGCDSGVLSIVHPHPLEALLSMGHTYTLHLSPV